MHALVGASATLPVDLGKGAGVPLVDAAGLDDGPLEFRFDRLEPRVTAQQFASRCACRVSCVCSDVITSCGRPVYRCKPT